MGCGAQSRGFVDQRSRLPSNEQKVKASPDEVSDADLHIIPESLETPSVQEAPWLPLDGSWVKPCSGDVEILVVSDGVARCSIGWMGFLKRKGSQVVLSYEWGYKSRYILRSDGALVCSGDHGNLEDGAVEWIPRDESLPLLEGPGQLRKEGKINTLVRRGALALLRSSYFEECWTCRQPIQRRQDIAERYFWDASEAMDLWQQHGRLFFTIISYGWLSKEHPDPDCYHLESLAGILRILRGYSIKWGLDDLAVVIDFCSLCQKDDDGNRTCEEMNSFREGLAGFPDLYVHLHVTSVKLACVPDYEERGYDDRGWTLAESVCIDSKAGDCNRLTLTAQSELKSVAMGTFDSIMKFARGPSAYVPLTLDGFKEKLEERRQRTTQKGLPLFTNGKADERVVVDVYEEAFACLQQATFLSFWKLGWTDLQIYDLCKVLRHCQTLSLCLAEQSIGDNGFHALIEGLFAVGLLRCLDIWGNQIGTVGAVSLLEVVPQMISLRAVFIDVNPCCKDSATMTSLRNAWTYAGKNSQYLTCKATTFGWARNAASGK